MYEYAFYRIPSLSKFPNLNADAYFEYCHQAIVQYSQAGWRFVKTLKPFGENMVSELVFERPVQANQ